MSIRNVMLILFFDISCIEFCHTFAIFVADDRKNIIHFTPMVASDWIFRSGSYGMILFLNNYILSIIEDCPYLDGLFH